MKKKTRKKNVQCDKLYVFIVDLRDFMLARDENTLLT